jgi:hypothetical protein
VLVTAVNVPFTGGAMYCIPRSSMPQLQTTERSGWLLCVSVAGAQCFALQFDTLIGRVNGGVLRELFFLSSYVWSVVTGIVGALNPGDPASCRAAQVVLVAVPVLSLTSLCAPLRRRSITI